GGFGAYRAKLVDPKAKPWGDGNFECAATLDRMLRRLPGDFLFPPRDIGIQRLGDAGVERRRLVGAEQLLPDRVGAFGPGLRAAVLPVLEIAPVAQHRLVEGALEPGQGVAGAEEMPAGADFADGVQAKAVLVDLDRVQELP